MDFIVELHAIVVHVKELDRVREHRGRGLLVKYLEIDKEVDLIVHFSSWSFSF